MKSSWTAAMARPSPGQAAGELARLRPVSSPEAARATGATRKAVVLGACCTSLFLTGLDNTAVNVGLPAIGTELHASVAGLQWVVAAYSIVLARLLMFSGSLADRIGRRKVF